MMNPRLILNKRIGRVIFFVEGPVDEPNLLRNFFCGVLGYRALMRGQEKDRICVFQSLIDPYSKVFVVPMPNSALVNIPGSETFLDAVYKKLASLGLVRDEAAVFYLFDRDRQSNKAPAVEEKIERLRNPLDNGNDFPGALILSYPCLQAYYCQAHGDPACFSYSKDAKKYVNSHGLNYVTKDGALLAVASMLAILHEWENHAFRKKNWMFFPS